MEIKTRFRDGVAILDISGEVVGNARFDLLEALQDQIDAGNTNIILNLKEVPMMGSVELGMLVACLIQTKRKSGKLVFFELSRSVRYLMMAEKLDNVFERYDEEDLALASFSQPQPVVAK